MYIEMIKCNFPRNRLPLVVPVDVISLYNSYSYRKNEDYECNINFDNLKCWFHYQNAWMNGNQILLKTINNLKREGEVLSMRDWLEIIDCLRSKSVLNTLPVNSGVLANYEREMIDMCEDKCDLPIGFKTPCGLQLSRNLYFTKKGQMYKEIEYCEKFLSVLCNEVRCSWEKGMFGKLEDSIIVRDYLEAIGKTYVKEEFDVEMFSNIIERADLAYKLLLRKIISISKTI